MEKKSFLFMKWFLIVILMLTISALGCEDGEDKDIKGLKSQIAELKTRLALMGTGHLRLSLEKISYLLAELTSRMDTYVNIKTEHEKRFAELEEKINQKLQTNLKEIFNLEKNIVNLEKRYEEIKQSGKTNQEHLQRIEDRINELREKLIAILHV